MDYRIIVPPGIGDFSWLWSKLCTSEDRYFIEYADTGPDRLGPFLALLPKEKIIGFQKNANYRVNFSTNLLEMSLHPVTTPGKPAFSVPSRATRYQDLQRDSGRLWYVEANTHLERGNRIEKWFPELDTDLHYRINGVENGAKEDIFIVHLSSFKMFKIWKTYDINQNIEIIDMLQKTTGLTPVFIGAEYDDFAKACYEQYATSHTARSVIGQTPDVLSALNTIVKSRFFLGSVSSGMTMLANVLGVPSASWWPRPGLPPSWPDTDIPYLWFMWENHKRDMEILERWCKTAW